MGHLFNEYARALYSDIITSIPRCYQTIFNSCASDLSSESDKMDNMVLASSITGGFSLFGGILGGVATSIATIGLGGTSPTTLIPTLMLGATTGAVSVSMIGMKFYAAAHNVRQKKNAQNKIEDYIFETPYEPIRAEAFPEFNKLRRKDKGMNP